jgi:hypothetical protein
MEHRFKADDWKTLTLAERTRHSCGMSNSLRRNIDGFVRHRSTIPSNISQMAARTSSGSAGIRLILAVHQSDYRAPAAVVARNNVLGRVGVPEYLDHLALSLQRPGKEDFVADRELASVVRQFNRLASAHQEKR